jgi:hypothetical protein
MTLRSMADGQAGGVPLSAWEGRGSWPTTRITSFWACQPVVFQPWADKLCIITVIVI